MRELYDMTPRERDLRYYGIVKKNLTQARQMRDLSYTIYCSVQPSDKRVEIWDYQPLPGDPSKKMREKARLKQAKANLKWLAEEQAKATEIFRRAGKL